MVVSLVSVLSFLAAIANYFNSSIQIERNLKEYASQIAEDLAHRSVLALVTHNEQDAKDAISPIMSFKDILGAAIYTPQNKLVYQQGNSWQHKEESAITRLKIIDSNDAWKILFPAFLTSSEQNEFEFNDTGDQYLGYVSLNVSKNSLKNIASDLLYLNTLTGLIIAIIVGILTAVIVTRLTKPIRELSLIMEQTRKAEQFKLAPTHGPKEVQRMASSFNQLMMTLQQQEQNLKDYNDRLESEVEIRTQELTQARDSALTALRTKSEFLANITHELRTPIQSIIGYIDLVSEELEFAVMLQEVEDLDKAKQAAARLLNLINSILALSKTEAGKMDLTIEKTSLKDIITECEQTVHPLVKNNKNTLSISAFDDIKISTDKEKLLQIILNLLSNACKFTEQGNIKVSIQLLNQMLQLEVRDTGIGLTEQQQKYIFEEFHQVDGSEQRKYGGTGLGLAISQSFAKLLGGKIKVSSQLGEGSCFTLELPISVMHKTSITQADVL